MAEKKASSRQIPAPTSRRMGRTAGSCRLVLFRWVPDPFLVFDAVVFLCCVAAIGNSSLSSPGPAPDPAAFLPEYKIYGSEYFITALRKIPVLFRWISAAADRQKPETAQAERSPVSAVLFVFSFPNHPMQAVQRVGQAAHMVDQPDIYRLLPINDAAHVG